MQRNDSIAAILSADRQRRRRLRSPDAKPAGSDRAVSHIDVLKAVKQPQSLKGRDHWEKFVFQVETYLALLESGYPEALEDARKATTFRDHVDISDSSVTHGTLLDWRQDMPVALKIAMASGGVKRFWILASFVEGNGPWVQKSCLVPFSFVAQISK